ncbi:MAG: septum formation protein Maf [Alphaproteobacteria bacterium]|nr:septum formation protein Maf [Alphaproteobacteria bacterium]
MKASVILASASPSRAAVLRNAGVSIESDPASIDEDAVKDSFRKDNGSAAQVAEALAELKAQRVSQRHDDALVIGADQMLQCGGIWFDKPVDLDQARGHLVALRGKTHELLAAVCVVRNGQCIWRHLESARLTMRSFSDAFLDEYLDTVGEAACLSVGAYQLEGRGAQLFSQIEGDYFTILGLPLLPLLGFLVNQGVVTA